MTRKVPVKLLDKRKLLPGQYFDQETGLHYNYFRDYDPNIGRYIESDPIGIISNQSILSYKLFGVFNSIFTINKLYVYAENNPIIAFDITGLVRVTILDITQETLFIYPSGASTGIKSIRSVTAEENGNCMAGEKIRIIDKKGSSAKSISDDGTISYDVNVIIFTPYLDKNNNGGCKCKLTSFQEEAFNARSDEEYPSKPFITPIN